MGHAFLLSRSRCSGVRWTVFVLNFSGCTAAKLAPADFCWTLLIAASIIRGTLLRMHGMVSFPAVFPPRGCGKLVGQNWFGARHRFHSTPSLLPFRRCKVA